MGKLPIRTRQKPSEVGSFRHKRLAVRLAVRRWHLRCPREAEYTAAYGRFGDWTEPTNDASRLCDPVPPCSACSPPPHHPSTLPSTWLLGSPGLWISAWRRRLIPARRLRAENLDGEGWAVHPDLEVSGLVVLGGEVKGGEVDGSRGESDSSRPMAAAIVGRRHLVSLSRLVSVVDRQPAAGGTPRRRHLPSS